MKRFIASLLIFISLSFTMPFRAECGNNASPEPQTSNATENRLIGIWRSVEDGRYIYEFTNTGEVIRYKLSFSTGIGRKIYIPYITIAPHTIIAGEEKCYFHFDNNYNTLLLRTTKELIQCRRLTKAQFNELTNGFTWEYQ